MSRNNLLDDDVEEEEFEETTLAEKLKRVWRNERCAPTLLQYESDLIEDCRQAVDEQAEEMEGVRNETTDSTKLFFVSLLELEIDRFKFLLRSYLRCRLQKIQKFNQYLLSDPDRRSLMSADETKLCAQYTDMMQKHYEECFLNQIPSTLRDLSRPFMTAEPPVHNHVFVRVLEDIGNVQMGEVEEVELKKDEIAVVKYSCVDELIRTHKLELV